jgi:hypothetical protein
MLSTKYIGMDWDEAFEVALFETDRLKVNAAQAAIDRRLQEMNADHGGSSAERYAIQTAQAGLNVLRKHAVFQ